MKKPFDTPARRRAIWVQALGLGLLLIGRSAWADIGPASSSQPASLQNMADPANALLLRYHLESARLEGFEPWAVNNRDGTGSDLTPNGNQAKADSWSQDPAPASKPQPYQCLALALLGLVMIGIGVICWLSGLECQRMIADQGIPSNNRLWQTELSPLDPRNDQSRYDWPQEV